MEKKGFWAAPAFSELADRPGDFYGKGGKPWALEWDARGKAGPWSLARRSRVRDEAYAEILGAAGDFCRRFGLGDGELRGLFCMLWARGRVAAPRFGKDVSVPLPEYAGETADEALERAFDFCAGSYSRRPFVLERRSVLRAFLSRVFGKFSRAARKGAV